MAVQFNDEAANPLPAGVHVYLYFVPPLVPISSIVANLVPAGDDWTQAGGLCPNLAPQVGLQYVAICVGRQAPPFAQPFAGGTSPTVVNCTNYRSSAMSETGWALLQTKTLWPKGQAWWGDAYREPGGGVAWATAYAFAAILRFLDCNAQNQLQAARVQSAQDSDVDTWAFDFLGSFFPRYQNESDLQYKTRIYAILRGPNTTLASIQSVCVMFYTYLASQIGYSLGGGTQADITGSADRSGGADITSALTAQGDVPTVYVWDRQSRPDLANKYDVNPGNDDGSFVIMVGIANATGWMLDNSYLDDNTWLIKPNEYTLSTTPPDARLGELVNLVKAGGTKPLYLTADLT